jgi:N-carbamoyl-L-amino-acid hydrolase
LVRGDRDRRGSAWRQRHGRAARRDDGGGRGHLDDRARGVSVAVEDFWISPATPFDEALVGHLREAAKTRGIAHRDMPTAIGHDAVYVARKLPAAMLFVPCHGGVSHNETESITPAWAEAGLMVLADAVLATAGLVKE